MSNITFLFLLSVLSANCFAQRTPCPSSAAFDYKGGTNYLKTFDPTIGSEIGVLANYNTPQGKTLIDFDLHEFRNCGQATLRIPVSFVYAGGDNCAYSAYGNRGINLDSNALRSDGSYGISDACETSIGDFFSKAEGGGVRGQSFKLIVGLFAQSSNDPTNWPANWTAQQYYIDLFEQNWRVTKKITELAYFANPNNIIDVGNELLATSGQLGLREYGRQMWQRFRQQFPSVQTMGFSVECGAGSCLSRLDNIPYVYGSDLPTKIGINMYFDVPSLFPAVVSKLNQYGMGASGLYITETKFNDAQTATDFLNATISTGKVIEAVIQWYSSGCLNGTCGPDVFPPTLYGFSEYGTRGF